MGLTPLPLFFSAIELFTLLADCEWLDEATKTIGQYWKRKNARRNGVIAEKPADTGETNVRNSR